MTKAFFFQLVLFLNFIILNGCSEQNVNSLKDITPNQFKGSDIQKIQAAVDKAAGTTGKVVIPAINSNDSGVWLLDSAVLLPSNITVILDNCTVQLSDSCRDNMFRSNNVGIGIRNPKWNQNISIIGVGDVTLKGANNPRSTGDSGKTLSLNPAEDYRRKAVDNPNNPDRGFSYGTDAGKKGMRQKGDWRNIMILIGYTDGFKLKNVNIEKTQAWAISHERVLNADISDIIFDCPQVCIINGKKQSVGNRDGINLRHGCKNFRINNISGVTGDNFIALSTLGLHSKNPQEGGILSSTMVTSRKWHGTEDDTERIFISNIICKSPTPVPIAIRANDVASINNVYINGLMLQGDNRGLPTMRVGDIRRADSRDSQPGKINNIHAMNIIGDGSCLFSIDAPIANCSFTNGIYKGKGDIIRYNIDKSQTTNVVSQNLIKIRK